MVWWDSDSGEYFLTEEERTRIYTVQNVQFSVCFPTFYSEIFSKIRHFFLRKWTNAKSTCLVLSAFPFFLISNRNTNQNILRSSYKVSEFLHKTPQNSEALTKLYRTSLRGCSTCRHWGLSDGCVLTDWILNTHHLSTNSITSYTWWAP